MKIDKSGRLGRVVRQLPNDLLEVDLGPNREPIFVSIEDCSCGILPGFIVQDIPVSASRKPLGIGTVIANQSIADTELCAVQLHATSQTYWLPYYRLVRIMDPALRYIRAEQNFENSGERTALNLMAHALRTWNEATGALDRLDVDPLPHQITLVHHILSSGNTNWLVADDVGLGKTIEVGLLLNALEKRQNLRRVLIVVPAGLTRQWKEEMLTKFDRQFRVFGLDFEISDTREWGLYEKVIVSLDLAKPKSVDDDGTDPSSRFGMLLAAGSWDLVVFDEAHRLSRDDRGRTTLRFRLARALREQCDSVILLTGTPHQGDVGKFQNLLKLVRPDLAGIIDDIDEDPNVVSDIVLRNRKIDVVDADGTFIFKGVLVRRAEILSSPEVVELERRLSSYLRRGYNAGDKIGGSSGRAIGFVMTIYRKLASSSVWALFVAMTRRKQRLLGQRPDGTYAFDLDEQEEADVGGDEDDLAESLGGTTAGTFFENELEELDSVIDQVKQCIPADRKFLELENLIAELVVDQKKKLLIFTEYRATQNYIKERLKKLVGGDVVEIHGGMSVDEKQQSVSAFNEDASILISTEAGGEGLNLQSRCHVLVNYDIPWNPARLQQRIGRLYRYGQSQKVVVVNIASKDTIDNVILSTVLSRLDAVVRQMGPVSDEYDERHASEVLGELLERIDINDLLVEARSGNVERSSERVDEAIRRAQQARSLQQDLLDSLSSRDEAGWKQLGSFTTKDLAVFVSRSAKLCEIEVIPYEDPERFDLRLPEDLRGNFREFGNRSIIEARTNRGEVMRNSSRVLLDFSSDIVKYLVSMVTDPEFGGGYGVTSDDFGSIIIGAMLVHFQNDQGEPRGVDLVVGTRNSSGLIEINNSAIRPLFLDELRCGEIRATNTVARSEELSAIFDRVEAHIAHISDYSRHSNGIFPVAVLEKSNSLSPPPEPAA